MQTPHKAPHIRAQTTVPFYNITKCSLCEKSSNCIYLIFYFSGKCVIHCTTNTNFITQGNGKIKLNWIEKNEDIQSKPLQVYYQKVSLNMDERIYTREYLYIFFVHSVNKG